MLKTKRCTKCNRRKALNAFATRGKKQPHLLQSACRRCHSRSKTKAQAVEANRRRNHAAKSKVIEAYGGKCECCSETHIEFLSIDHPNGDGQTDRKVRGGWGYVFYRALIREDFPPGYRILCMNCNWATRHGKTCPHQRKDNS